MDLTNSQRVAKLIGSLTRHPGDIRRYVSNNLIRRRSPVELELPWFSYAAIDFLDGYLRPDMHAFEFGSGGSTLFLARRCKSVTCVEEDERWLAPVAERIAKQNITNVRLLHTPFNFNAAAGFENSKYLEAVRQSAADVVIIDGTDLNREIRPICFRVAEESVRADGIIVVDDSWRYTQLRETNRARRVEVFESVGPARFGVTSTDVYFY